MEQIAESNRLRFAKYLAVCMLAAVALKVVPALGQNSVDHALMLTETREAFWKKAGVERVRLIAKTATGAQKLLERGAAGRLVSIVEASDDAELTMAALQAIAEFADRSEAAREAFVSAGMTEALSQAAQQEGPSRELAAQLLVAFTVQRDHVD